MKERTTPPALRASAHALPPLRSERLLDQVRERVRYLHFSIRTEQAYVQWVRAFVRFHDMRHPAEMGAAEVEAFLSWLAAERRVAASTHRQALSAIVFLYQKAMIYTHVLKLGGGAVRSPLDLLRLGPPTIASAASVADASIASAATRQRSDGDGADHDSVDVVDGHDDDHEDRGHPLLRARQPALRYSVLLPCSRATPSSTARATSAS